MHKTNLMANSLKYTIPLIVSLAFITPSFGMGGEVPLTPAELAKHNATISKVSREAAGAKKAEAKPVVLHRAVVPQPKPAPLAKTKDPVKAKPSILERFIALKRRWF